MMDVQWWLSAYDNRVHAFGSEEAGRDFGEALCEHCVPNDKLIFGDLLADTCGEAAWRAS
jgi:hypothetical protein